MKYLYGMGVILIIFIISATVLYGSEGRNLPLLLNYQSILYDDGGNLMPDGETTVYFRIYDQSTTVLYEEVQNVDVVYGVASAIIGNGLNAGSDTPTGGMPVDVFDPTGQRFLEVQVAGYAAEPLMEIVSTPYSMWAQKALEVVSGSVDESSIAQGAIKEEHINKDFLDELIPDLFDKGRLPADVLYTADLDRFSSEMAGSQGASNVGVAAGFTYSASNDVQNVLADLDQAVLAANQSVASGTQAIDQELDGIINTLGANTSAIQSHKSNTSNPHSVTLGQLGGVSTTTFNSHKDSTGNPHSVTLGQLGGVSGSTFNSHNHDGGSGGGTISFSSISGKPTSTYTRNNSTTFDNTDNISSCYSSGGTWWCSVSVGCDGGDLRTGCGSRYNYLCEGGKACDFLGVWPTGSRSCTAQVGQDIGATQTLSVYAICLSL